MSAHFVLGRHKFTNGPIHIKSVNPENKHDFICLDCGKQLTCVLNVSADTKHFKHRTLTCNATSETLLHITVKEIIAQNSKIKLPDGLEFEYVEVLLEKKWDKYKPDITLKSNDKTLFVEVIVSNPISWDKELTFSKKMQDCLIIDLSYYLRDFDVEQLKLDVLEGKDLKRMIYGFKKGISHSKNANDKTDLLKLLGFGIGGYLLYKYFQPTPIRKRKYRRR
ncbi:competence protein CoiA family protein [Pedobacter namyangjuensis]|uniref:hypothetical protein n=1 Tax=Pedobacter namyangjuensis TaxID=600626 RepID=UPI0013B46DE3|nr:hypothetical protein [Pedobacter namyangjuensis]